MSDWRWRFGLAFAALLASAPSFAHKFFEGLVSLEVNPKNGHLEVISRYTAHDLQAVLAERSQQHINLELPEHQQLLQQYVQSHFQLRKNEQPVALDWVGIEDGVNEVVIYQESMQPISLSGLRVMDWVLLDTLYQQVNRVNYQQQGEHGTLVFDGSQRWQTIP